MKFPYNKALDIRAQYQAGKIDRETAKEQLAFVLDLKNDSDFCKEAVEENPYSTPVSYGPLLRLSDVCNTLSKWAKAFYSPLPTDSKEKAEERNEFFIHWGRVELAIRKSCLLDRLFHQEETLRTEPCPEHKGRWSGCVWENLPCGCQNGSNVTGWLPAPEFVGYSDDPDAPLCSFCGKPPMKQGLWSSRVDNKHGHPECMDANPMVKKNAD